MPLYEYLCLKCGEKIEIKMTFEEKEKGLKMKCPKCGSEEITQVLGNFFVSGQTLINQVVNVANKEMV